LSVSYVGPSIAFVAGCWMVLIIICRDNLPWLGLERRPPFAASPMLGTIPYI
jgi:hypothetical protein